MQGKAALERLLGVAVLALAVSAVRGQEQAPELQGPPPTLHEPCGCPEGHDVPAGIRLLPPMLGDLAVCCLTADGFKVAENESPRPLDRVFTAFNYYNSEVPRMLHQEGLRRADIYRELFGLEKTFLDGAASVGLRLPLDTFQAESGTVAGGNSTDVGDLDIILKYALINATASGSALSVGLVVTAPTGPTNFAGFGRFPPSASPHDTLLQPFVGYVWNLGDWYVQGFFSLVVPTAFHDTTLLFNDFGAGYFAYRNSSITAALTALMPTAEVHVNTPLDRVGKPFVDSVDLTQGVIFELYHRAWLALGVSENVTGPKTYDIEAIAQFNVLF
jgi:hypothetical protein